MIETRLHISPPHFIASFMIITNLISSQDKAHKLISHESLHHLCTSPCNTNLQLKKNEKLEETSRNRRVACTTA